MITINVESKQFSNALELYAAATRKDLAYVVNRGLYSLAYYGTKCVKVANRSEIKALPTRPFWNKFIASVLAKKWRRHKTKAGFRYYTRAQARRHSRKIIRIRSRAIGFLRFFWITAMRAIAPYVGRSESYGKDFSGFRVRVRPATSENLCAEVRGGYSIRRKGIGVIEALLRQSFIEAQQRAAADMREYALRVMARRGEIHSARR